MIDASELLQSYVQGIRHLSGAEAVTLYVPATLSGLSRSSLLHDGDPPYAPELADAETALAFWKESNQRLQAAKAEERGPLPCVLTSSADNTCLIPLPAVQSVWALAVLPEQLLEQRRPTPARRHGDVEEEADLPGAWLALRFPAGEGDVMEHLLRRNVPAELRRGDEQGRWWDWLFALGGALASHTLQVTAILRDPITDLPDRAGLQALLSEELERARLKRRPLSLLLINPDEFGSINERFGREAGDRIVREISARLRSALRSSDSVARYGGVVFAATLTDTPLEGARAAAEKILQQVAEAAFLDGAVRLGFSIGVAVFEPGDKQIAHPLDLIRRADQALNAAKRLGGGSIVDWEQRSGAEETGNFDRLSGIFTGNMAKDYRNMVLMWDTIDVIAVNREFEGLAAQAVEKLYSTFKPDRAALLDRDDEGNLRLVRGITRRPTGSGTQRRVDTVELGSRQRNLLALSIAEAEPREELLSGTLFPEESESEADRRSYAVPLIVSDECLGCLYIDGRQDSLNLDASDLIFLRALASQLAVALDRARLSELEKKRQELERRELRAELNELRQALQQAKLVYRSAEMETVLATARRVAPTDATVLVTGPSGTGKELLARTIHELSPRSEHPFVIVDCGAIATSLIESELFGHEKGAYTGAQQRRIGRLAEANRGTVLLDEIGELPLEVQSKLLRFVQEKQFTTVGGSKPRRVDVRIVAATNRDLGVEVAAGRFREDLYYRLNVVRLEVPALRHRPDDVLHLARHFLETYTVQFHKQIRHFSSAAEEHLVRHLWPGNVRELQNRVMQAVILCEGEEIGPDELGLPATSEDPGTPRAATGPVPAAGRTGEAPDSPAPGGAVAASPGELFAELRAALRRQIELLASGRPRHLMPLGRWLGDDLVLEADRAAGGTARQGAAIVGIPETTFRRRLHKASEQAEAGLSPRSGTWDEVRQVLSRLVRTEELAGSDLPRRAERILLEEIRERFPADVRTGSALLGVTAPTFRRRMADLEAAASNDGS